MHRPSYCAVIPEGVYRDNVPDVPDLAMVPRFLTRSSLVMPTPVSWMVSNLFAWSTCRAVGVRPVLCSPFAPYAYSHACILVYAWPALPERGVTSTDARICTLMRISSSDLSPSCFLSVRDRNLILSRASAALEISSRRKISCSIAMKFNHTN